jgi:hypothetical protein
MLNYTVDQLVQDVLATDNTPISQQTFTPEQVVRFMDYELRNTIVPIVTKAREEYFVHTWAFPIEAGVSTGFTIPGQAAGFRLRDIYLYDDTGKIFLQKFRRINPDQIPVLTNWAPAAMPTYYIENNDIVFYPRLNSTGLLKVRYFKAPNHLSLMSDAGGQITAKLAGNVLQLDNVPSSWTVFSGPKAVKIDMTGPDAPFNFIDYPSAINYGQPIIAAPLLSANVSTAQITVDNDVYAAAQVGDYIWENDKCGFVQFFPFESLQLITLRASMNILKAQGDIQNLSVSAQLFNAKADDFMNLISPKVENQPKRVWTSANMMRGRGGYYGRTW